MTIRQKLTINAVVIGSVILLLAAVGVSSLIFIKSKLSYLLSTSTPFQVRTIDLQRTLQVAVSDLLKASVSGSADELARQKANFGKSFSEMKEAEDALEKLSGQHSGLYEDIGKLSGEIFDSAGQRLQSESETRQAGASISEKMKDMTARLKNLDSRVSAMQSGYSKGLKDDFESSKTSSVKLRDMEALKSSLDELNNMIITLPHTKERKQALVLKSKSNSILDNLLESRPAKASREMSSTVTSLKQKVSEFFELNAANAKQPSDETMRKIEAASAEIRENLILSLETTLNQSVDFLTMEASSRNKHQDISFAQSGLATNVLADNAALMTAGLSVESFVAKLLNAYTSGEVDYLAEQIRKSFDRANTYQKTLEQNLTKLGAKDELVLLRNASSALHSIRDLIYAGNGVIAKIRQQAEMKERAADAGNRLRQTVNKYTEAGRQDVLVAHKAQEDSTASVNRVVGLSISSSIIIGVVAILVSIIASIALFRTVVIPIKRTEEIFEYAERDNDLTKRPKVETHDEIGDLCSSYNKFMDKLHSTINDVAGFTSNLASSSSELSATSQQMTGRARTQVEETESIATASEEMSATVLDVSRNAQDASEFAMRLKNTSLEGGEVVRQSIHGIKAVSVSFEDISSIIDKLASSSEQIGKIVSVIKDISDQTNLLALNAAIEAARAGEQ
ncbi:MAG: methyl-accepting chemotaxis protein [Dissulfurispiraceae bacterium]